MSFLQKISLLTIPLSLLATTGYCAYGKHKIKIKHKITVGAYATKEPQTEKQTPELPKKSILIPGNTLFINQQLFAKFKSQISLKKETLPNYEPPKNKPANTTQLSVPIAIQYYLLTPNYTILPFIGTGIQYNIAQPYHEPTYTNKRITVVFTQGFSLEVNTKIEVTQSIHIISNNENKVIGIDLGIGYKFQ